jgi:hypothetical protein
MQHWVCEAVAIVNALKRSGIDEERWSPITGTCNVWKHVDTSEHERCDDTALDELGSDDHWDERSKVSWKLGLKKLLAVIKNGKSSFQPGVL